MFGMVQNLSTVVGKAEIIVLQFNSILFEQTTVNEPATCLCYYFPGHISFARWDSTGSSQILPGIVRELKKIFACNWRISCFVFALVFHFSLVGLTLVFIGFHAFIVYVPEALAAFHTSNEKKIHRQRILPHPGLYLLFCGEPKK